MLYFLLHETILHLRETKLYISVFLIPFSLISLLIYYLMQI